MFRTIICDADGQEALQLRGLIDKLLASCAVLNYETLITGDPLKVVAALGERKPGFFDVVLFRERSADDGTMAAVRTLRENGDVTPFVLLTPIREHAMDAYDTECSFFPLPGGFAAFRRVMEPIVRDATERAAGMLLVKSRKGLDNVALRSVLFVETARGGLVIHLPNDETVVMRSTLQGLYEQLEHDSRFVKAGSSFILNLDNVRSIGESSVIFADGEAIIVPVRARKPLKDEYRAYCQG